MLESICLVTCYQYLVWDVSLTRLNNLYILHSRRTYNTYNGGQFEQLGLDGVNPWWSKTPTSSQHPLGVHMLNSPYAYPSTYLCFPFFCKRDKTFATTRSSNLISPVMPSSRWPPCVWCGQVSPRFLSYDRCVFSLERAYHIHYAAEVCHNFSNKDCKYAHFKVPLCLC